MKHRTRCKRGHDLTLSGAVYIQHRPCGRVSRTCRLCKVTTQEHRARALAQKLGANAESRYMTPHRVEEILAAAVRRETAMAWVRHPQPWD